MRFLSSMRFPFRARSFILMGAIAAVSLGFFWLTHQDQLGPQAFLEAIGWAEKPGSTLIFPRTGAGDPLLPRSAPGLRVGLLNMLRVDRFGTSALLIPGGQDPEAIPVVLVHGLMSTPDMWDGVVRALRSDPGIARHFQFWTFYYPTGQPIPISALQLRETLDEAVRRGRLTRSVVLIGHSMGGIISRAQAVTLTPEDAEEILPGVASLPPNDIVRRSLVFPARSDIARLVFIATPHRGTDFALRPISRLGHRLIRLPQWLYAEAHAIHETFPGVAGRRLPTSIFGLLPTSGFLRELDKAPLHVPAHSIIPVLGDPDDPFANDGVVPLKKARIPAARSELLIPGAHGAFDSSESLAELRRILREHIGLDAKSGG